MASDVDRLQGSWKLATVEVDGEAMPPAAVSGAGIVIDGNRFTSTGMGGTYEGTFEVDETTTPKTLDMHITGGHAAGSRHAGIYELAGGRWTLCLAMDGGPRPHTFATAPGTGLALETFERGPASDVSGAIDQRRPPTFEAVAAEPDATPQSGPATALEGEWQMLSGVFNGVAMPESMVAWAKRVTHGDVTSVLAGPKVMLRASFTIDESARPWTIDYVNLEGAEKGKPQTGIAEIADGILRICMGAPGQPRPAEFASSPGDKRSFTTWRPAGD